MKQLFDLLKKETLPAVWAQGAKLSRENAVLVERESASEIVLRVRTPGRTAHATAVLYPEDGEWTCDCAGPVDPCAHVVAGALSARQAKERGEALPSAQDSLAQLIYSVRTLQSGDVTLDRFILSGGNHHKIDGNLSPVQGKFSFSPSPGDVTVDRILSAALRGILRPTIWPTILDALSDAKVELDGKRVSAATEAILPEARVYDEGPNVVLRIQPSAELSRVIGCGLGLVGETLRPFELMDLTGFRLERLPIVQTFDKAHVSELVRDVLPGLEARMTVHIESKRLPRRSRKRAEPRIVFEIDNDVHTLTVLPRIAYGDPPEARLEKGKLVLLTGDVLPQRDEPAELKLIARLRDELNLVPDRRVGFDGQEAHRFATKLRDFQQSLGQQEHGLVRSTPLVPRLSIAGDVLNVDFVLEESAANGDGKKQPKSVVAADVVLRAFEGGLSLVPLTGGGWAPLPADWLKKFGHRIADLLAARDAEGRVAPVATFALAALCEELGQPVPPSYERLKPLISDFGAIPTATLPSDLDATLRPYQRTGVDWLCFLRDAKLGAVLADDMGLGKTLQTLCAIRGRTLVVCPKSVVHNWEAEARRFRPGLSVSTYQGPKRTLEANVDLTITTYAVLRLDSEILAREQFDTVVLDEAQAIKNPDSQVSRAAYALKADFSIALSGTPLENRLEELWSILHFSHRGLLGGRAEFRDRYAEPIERGENYKLQELRKKTKPFILRRLKQTVAPELPERTDVVLEIDLDDSERELYSALHAATRREVLEKLSGEGNVIQALEALLRLRQASCHPALIPGQKAESSSKIEALLESLEQVAAEGHRALVFSQWTSLLDLIEPHLNSAQISFSRLDGSTRDRGKVVNDFQAEGGPSVLLTSLKAGGTGLNLTAADHVFLLDPWWNPAAEDQAADRAHRIGQKRPVVVYRLIAKNTVEEGILALQGKKRALAAAALEGAGNAAGITRDDLLALLA